MKHLPLRIFLLLCGCAPVAVGGMAAGSATTHGTAERERGAGGLFNTAAEEHGPTLDRCSPGPGRTIRKGCAAAKREAFSYARQLSVGDKLCLEGTSGALQVTHFCRVRAAVVDAATGKVLVEIREAQPGSKYVDKVQHQIWFYDNALVDLYLEAKGY